MGRGFVYGLNFQKGISPVMNKVIGFHDVNLAILIVIAVFILGIIGRLFTTGFSSSDFLENKWVECVWTCIPVLILVFLAVPSLELLYYLDAPASTRPFLTLKVTGRQWYWSYEYEVLKKVLSFDSYMVKENELGKEGLGVFRLLEVDNPVFLPRTEYRRLLITAGDVLHSFAVPSLGIKVDAVPGRLNQAYVVPLNLGSYYGQCSEICGANHRFMPINIEVVPKSIMCNV